MEADAINNVNRIKYIPFGFRHFLTFAVADKASDNDLFKGDFSSKLHAHHDHSGYPEKDDVKASE